MSDINESNMGSLALSARDSAAKTNALIAYVLMVIGLFTGIFWILGAVWAMVKKGDAQDTIFADHYSNITKTFWLGIVFWVIGFFLTFILIGYAVLFAAWIWSIYRVVNGLAKITSNKSYYG